MRELTDEEQKARDESSRRGFWLMATSGHADSFGKALGLFIYWTVLSVAFFMFMYWLISVMTMDTPIDGS